MTSRMRVVTLGRGSVGGGLAKLWRTAGHEVETLGRDGGDASGADAVLIAVPWTGLRDAVSNVTGLEGKVTIDAMNDFTGRDDAFPSLAHEVKSLIGGPVAKAFNINVAVLYDEVNQQRVRPSQLYVAEAEAKAVTEQLIRDAGFDPVCLGGLENARMLEDHSALAIAAINNGLGRFFYRMAPPGQL